MKINERLKNLLKPPPAAPPAAPSGRAAKRRVLKATTRIRPKSLRRRMKKGRKLPVAIAATHLNLGV